MTSSIRYDFGADGIVLLTLDAPNDPVNTMNAAFQVDLAAVLARLTAEKEQIKGVVFTSAKSTFFAGGDLRWLITAKPTHATWREPGASCRVACRRFPWSMLR